MEERKTAILLIGGSALACVLLAIAMAMLLPPQFQLFGGTPTPPVELPEVTPSPTLPPTATATPTPRPTATPTATPMPTSTPRPQTAGVTTLDGLHIEIVDVIPDAWPMVHAQNSYNDPPAKGRRMILVTVRVTAEELPAGEFQHLDESDFKLMDGDKTIYTTYGDSNSCGVVPSGLSGVVGENIPLIGNICWQIPKRAEDLTLLYAPMFGDNPIAILPLPSGEP